MKNNYKNTGNIVSMSLVLFFAISCSNDKLKEEKSQNDNGKEIISASDSTEIKFQAMKEKYSQQIKEEITETDKKIDELNEQFDKAKGKLKNKLKEEITEWQAKKQILKETWDKIEKTTKDNWENFEKEMKDTLRMVQDSVKTK
ncbi:MAG: hypothetical protein HYU69_13850 [Bacteroidetes bacterium]|nr:hypothetical protein [Bacteroidota bacterium]